MEGTTQLRHAIVEPAQAEVSGLRPFGFQTSFQQDGDLCAVVYLDLRGNGRSDAGPSNKWSLEQWAKDVHAFCEALAIEKPIVLGGDYNVAPEEEHVFSVSVMDGQVLFTSEERARYRKLRWLGLTDAFKALNPAPHQYSWWDYRAGGFRRNLGLRIDHIWVSAPLAARSKSTWIDKAPRGWERPSDHAPVVAEFD